jgi:hypothetical protein
MVVPAGDGAELIERQRLARGTQDTQSAGRDGAVRDATPQ